jgi:hypothetical protein
VPGSRTRTTRAQLFGSVASDPTAWRLLSNLDSRLLDRLAQARNAARETAWAQRIETRGGLPQTSAAGRLCAALRRYSRTEHQELVDPLAVMYRTARPEKGTAG